MRDALHNGLDEREINLVAGDVKQVRTFNQLCEQVTLHIWPQVMVCRRDIVNQTDKHDPATHCARLFVFGLSPFTKPRPQSRACPRE